LALSATRNIDFSDLRKANDVAIVPFGRNLDAGNAANEKRGVMVLGTGAFVMPDCGYIRDRCGDAQSLDSASKPATHPLAQSPGPGTEGKNDESFVCHVRRRPV
jgi:hypothetical protein